MKTRLAPRRPRGDRLARRLRCRRGPPKPASGQTPGGQEPQGDARLRALHARATASTCPTRSSSGGRVTQRMQGRQPGEDARRREGVREVPRARSRRRRCPPSEKEEFKKAALANARCMREHGHRLPRPDVRRQRRRADQDRQGPEPGVGQVPGGPEGVREDAARRAEHVDGRRGREVMRRRLAGGGGARGRGRRGGVVVGDRRRDARSRPPRRPRRGRRRRSSGRDLVDRENIAGTLGYADPGTLVCGAPRAR